MTGYPYCFGVPARSARNHGNAPDGKWCDECDAFEECQEASRNPPKILTFNLEERYFLEIQAGRKKNEIRIANDYWKKRIVGKTFDVIEICNKYPRRGDLDNRMYFLYKGYARRIEKWATHRDGIIDACSFVFDLTERIPYPYRAIEMKEAMKEKTI